MGKKSRDKGANGERELASLLRDLLQLPVIRTGMTQAGTAETDKSYFDLEIGGTLGIEVKRHARFTDAHIERFWMETVEQSKLSSKIGVLAYRPDNQIWRIVVPDSFVSHDPVGRLQLVPNYEFTHTLMLPGFVRWYEQTLADKTTGVVNG